MLGGVDKALTVVTWVAAGLVALMLFVGPQVVAEDEPAQSGGEAAGAAPYGGGGGGKAAADGKRVFTDRCGSCHALSAAGTSGGTGPNLDDVSLTTAEVERIVREGRGALMPAFAGQLSDAEIRTVAAYVASGG